MENQLTKEDLLVLSVWNENCLIKDQKAFKEFVQSFYEYPLQDYQYALSATYVRCKAKTGNYYIKVLDKMNKQAGVQ